MPAIPQSPATTAVVERVTVNGVALFTRAIGEGPDVIVLHGGPGAHHDYLLPQFDALAAGRRLRYYDQRGGGRSPVDRSTPVGWREHVADLEGLVLHWGVAPATILGYSWGGLLAMLYAAEHPKRVGRLALVAPAPIDWSLQAQFERRFETRQNRPEIVQAQEALRDSDLRSRDLDAYRQRAFELSVAGYFNDPARAHDLTPFRVTGRTQQAVWRSLRAADLEAERKQLCSLEIPTLVLHGRHDPIPLAGAEQVAECLHARLEILEHSGHVPHVEQFEEFLSLLDTFLPKAA